MKKLLIIIVVLTIIFIGMYIYKNNKRNNQNVTIDEINKIEEYIEKIYMWKEVTQEALPCFDDINQASELWIWKVVEKNIEEYDEITYEQISSKTKEIFGAELKKEMPKEGNEYFIYEPEEDKYYTSGIILDEKDDNFLLNKIQKTNDGYEIEIVEYIEDYSKNEEQVVIENTNEEEIQVISIDESETNRTQKVKDNIDRFNKKKVALKRENENLVVKKVENV